MKFYSSIVLLKPCLSLFALTCLISSLTTKASTIYVPWDLAYNIGPNFTVDLDQDGLDDVNFNADGLNNVSWNGGIASNHNTIVSFFTTGTLYNPALNLVLGSAIPTGGPRANTGYFRYYGFPGPTEYGQFANTRGYAGFQIETGVFTPHAGFRTDEIRYGWLDISTDTTSSSGAFTLHGWAYETIPSTGLLAGAGASRNVPDATASGALLFVSTVLLAVGRFRIRQS